MSCRLSGFLHVRNTCSAEAPKHSVYPLQLDIHMLQLQIERIAILDGTLVTRVEGVDEPPTEIRGLDLEPGSYLARLEENPFRATCTLTFEDQGSIHLLKGILS